MTKRNLNIFEHSTISSESSKYFIVNIVHCVNSVRIRSFSGTYFPALGLNVFSSNAGK